MQDLNHLICEKDVCEILEEFPENAYFIEKGSVPLYDLIASNGFVSLRRYFSEPPNVIAYFTIKDKPEEGSSSNSNTAKLPKSVVHESSKYSICYKLLPSSLQVRMNAIMIKEPQMYEREAADVTLRYVAYIRGKPFDNSMTPLVNLILQGTPGVEQKIQAWLNEGHHYISATNSDEQSLLHVAAQQSNFAVVKWLVDHKADVTLPDRAGWTPIFCALNSSDLRCAYYLAQNGGLNEKALTSNGSSPLHYLARTIPSSIADTDKFIFLFHKCIEVYGTVACCPTASRDTPLHKAALAGNIFMAKMLIASVHTVSLDPNCKNRRGLTGMHLAIASGNQEMVQFLASSALIDIPPADSPGSPQQLCMEVNKPNLLALLPKNGKPRFANLTRYILTLIFEMLKADPTACTRCLRVSKGIQQVVTSVIDTSFLACNQYWVKLYKVERRFQRISGVLPAVDLFPSSAEFDYHYGMVVVESVGGEGSHSFCSNALGSDGYKMPIGNSEGVFGTTKFIVDGKRILMKLWHKPRNPHVYQGVQFIFVVFDGTAGQSLAQLKRWQKEIATHAHPGVITVFISTKETNRSKKEDITTLLKETARPYHHSAIEYFYPIVIETRPDKPSLAYEAMEIAAKLKALIDSYPDNAQSTATTKKKGFLKFFK